MLGLTHYSYEGQELANSNKRCTTNFMCDDVNDCEKGLGYCNNGVCGCLKLRVMDTNKANPNHQGQCDTNLECYTMGCIRGPGYCDNGVCKCPKSQV
ncbi:unnamed protein product [Thlaspi arvense]|uniref:Uncharacterized protein n=1 Tax=Thlaspi arvense TaxID=13288 RepID=A0AAU9RCC5_THLAR|nr:unnamed protein product [Thlaspi arvense]